MAALETTAAHPRPAVDEEPPLKQLKLSVGDEVSKLAVPVSQPDHVMVTEESDAAPVVGGSANVAVGGTRISADDVISDVSLMVIENEKEDDKASKGDGNEQSNHSENGTENGSRIEGEGIAPAVQSLGSNSLPSDLGSGTSSVARTKTSLCSYFRRKGCNHGDKCRFAHGEEELKPRPDGSWDPTSERAKGCLPKETVPPPLVVSAEPEKVESAGNSLSKCILRMPRTWTVDNLKDLLKAKNISYTTTKKRKGMTVAFVGFKTLGDVASAIEVLDGMSLYGNQLKVVESRPRSWEKTNPVPVKNIEDDSAGDDEMTEGVNDPGLDDSGIAAADCVIEGDLGEVELAALSREGTAGQTRNVKDAVTPYGHMAYEEQLDLKRSNISNILKRLVRNTRKSLRSGDALPDWVTSARDRAGLPCELEGILASPIVDGYRNKCEFSIGCSADGKRVVGFQIGSFREGILAVAEPTDCRNVSAIARHYAAAFQEFVRQSELPVWNKLTNSGFWRLLIVREGRAAGSKQTLGDNLSQITEVMLVVQVCSTGIDEEKRNTEYAKMADVMSQAANSTSPPLPLTALVVQDHVGISNVASPDAPLHPLVLSKSENDGELAPTYIHDHISNLRFRISPTAFFQVNTLAAERLYNLAGDWAGLNEDTLLFDVCCGTGTIGLTLAHRVGLVVGIELNESAVADARKNAEINNITNCRFVCGKAEAVMENLLKEYTISVDEPSASGTNDSEAGVNKIQDDNDVIETTETNENSSSILIDNGKVETKNEDSAAVGSISNAKTGKIKASNGEQNQEQQKRRFKNIVVIVDPPRVGLHPLVLKTLRLHGELRRLVYISCNPGSLLANAVELCTPLSGDPNAAKGNVGWQGRGSFRRMNNVGLARQRIKKMPPSEPFTPKRAIAVDLFPHTTHCETVLLLER